MKLAEVRRTAKRFQDLLSLNHWEIEIEWMTAEECKEHPDWNGFCIWNEQHAYAQIFIHRKSEDILNTLVHEMLHLRIDGWQPFDPKHHACTEKEISINALTKALMQLI